MRPVRPVRGVQLVKLDRHADSRGSLLHFGTESPLPFEVRNVYFLVDCPLGAIRAEHANSNHSAIIALSSTVTIDVDNGAEQGSHRLSESDSALIIRAGVWLRLREFTPQTCVVVLSSRLWEETTHFKGPEPSLLDDAGW
jgi:hypothetical protein